MATILKQPSEAWWTKYGKLPPYAAGDLVMLWKELTQRPDPTSVVDEATAETHEGIAKIEQALDHYKRQLGVTPADLPNSDLRRAQPPRLWTN